MTDVRPTQRCVDDTERPCQGAIYKDVYYLDGVDLDESHITVHRILFPYVCVLSQDCDLESDSRERVQSDRPHYGGAVLSVLVAPMYNADHVARGTHLDQLEIPLRGGATFVCHTFVRKTGKPGDDWKNWVIKNRNPRYHYLAFDKQWGLVPMVIDFRHYFAVSVDVLRSEYVQRCLGRLDDLERAHLCQRFSSFLSRVGLPAPGPDLADGPDFDSVED